MFKVIIETVGLKIFFELKINKALLLVLKLHKYTLFECV